MNRILTIAGSDSGGGAGIQADLKTITVLGGYGLSVITALTAQNTLGVQAVYELPPAFIAQEFDSVLSDIGADAAKTGMLANPEVVRIVAEKIKEYKVSKLVVDPVMVAKGGDSLLTPFAREALAKELLPLASVITPNLPEAGVLLGREVKTLEDMAEAARELHRKGAQAVLIKGGHFTGPATDILFDGREIREYTAKRIGTPNTHGTGCTYSAAIATYLGQGLPLPEAVGKAKEFITEAIRLSLPLGRGHGPTNHFALLAKRDVLHQLTEAFETLSDAEAGRLIPEVQTNIGYALPAAETAMDVAAFPGRIVRLGDKAANLGPPRFGASRHVANIILTAMKTDPASRAAMNIRYNESLLDKGRKLGLKVEGFDRADEPAEVKAREGSTLAWGVSHTIDRCGFIPDLIFDRGDVGKEPMIRVLGPTPLAVVTKALSLLGDLQDWKKLS